MIKSTKNIFAIVTIALSCVPALHCEGRQQQISQDTLKNLIAQANVTEFKKSFYTFIQSRTDSNELTVALRELNDFTQKIRQIQQQEFEAMGETQTNRIMLTKGILQMIMSLCMAGYTTVNSLKFVSNASRGHTIHNKLERKKQGIQFGCVMVDEDGNLNPQILPTYEELTKQKLECDTINKKIFLSTTFSIPLSILSMYYGIKNCINGWDYKAYLEQQIKNLDEISTHIQTIRFNT